MAHLPSLHFFGAGEPVELIIPHALLVQWPSGWGTAARFAESGVQFPAGSSSLLFLQNCAFGLFDVNAASRPDLVYNCASLSHFMHCDLLQCADLPVDRETANTPGDSSMYPDLNSVAVLRPPTGLYGLRWFVVSGYVRMPQFLPVVAGSKIHKAAGDGEEDLGSRERDYGGRCGPLCDARAGHRIEQSVQ